MDLILTGLEQALALDSLLFIAAGLVIGIVIGATPGLNVPLAVAIALPVTFNLDPVGGIAMLVGIYKGGTYGGSLSAVLINVPGTPAAAATALDGSALTRKGQAGKALKMSLYASVTGGIVSDIALILLAVPAAAMALKFGPTENFALGVFSLTLIGVLSQGLMVNGLIAGALGVFLSTFGLDSLTGQMRLTFGYYELAGGWAFIALVIGVFAVAEALNMAFLPESGRPLAARVDFKAPEHRLSREDWRRSLWPMLRATPIGVFIGAIPGLGSAISAFLNYGITRNLSKEPERFGKGAIEGVATAEAGNNAVTSSTFIPLLTLGIPGDVITAIMLGAFMVHGLIPGPGLFEQHGDFVAAFFVIMLIGTGLHFVIGRLGLPFFALAVQAPARILFPVVLVLCVTGTYVATNNFFDLYVMLGFGVLGFFMNRWGFPVAPLLIGFILGPLVEVGFRQALILSQGSWLIFIERPISLTFLILALATILWVGYREWKGTKPA